MRTARRASSDFFARAIAALILLTCSSVAYAHDTSVTHVEADLHSGELTLTLWLNQNDLLQTALRTESGRTRFRDEDELKQSAQAIDEFVRRGVTVTRAGKRLEAARDGEWPPDRITLTEHSPDGTLSPVAIPFTLRFPGPTATATPTSQPGVTPADAPDAVEAVFRLYDNTGLTATYSVSVSYPGLDRPELVIVGSGGAVRLPVKADSTADGRSVTATSPASSVRDHASRGAVWRRGTLGTFAYFVPIGFEHILPEGLDHILFVLGLFLLSPRIKPLLAQVAAFTVAHSITLALASLEIVRLPSSVVEPLISLSIAFVAIENLFMKTATRRRWILVFVFGLIHGLGFAGALSEIGLPRDRLLSALIGFNVGVELGQLAVIAIAALVLAWWRNRAWYRPWVSSPISCVIAAVALFWTVQRIWA